MSEPYLIAHVVCGAAAFDVAERMMCPLCGGTGEKYHCVECDDSGWWWIIPTSGHRAYPYSYVPLPVPETMCREPPSGWPDHYKHGPAPKIDIKSLFKSEPKSYMPRRL